MIKTSRSTPFLVGSAFAALLLSVPAWGAPSEAERIVLVLPCSHLSPDRADDRYRGVPEACLNRFDSKGNLIQAGRGWLAFQEHYEPLIRRTGVNRIFLDRIGGLPNDKNRVVQFGSLIQCKKDRELKPLAAHGPFVKSWRAFNARHGLTTIAYTGTPSYDNEYIKLQESGDLLQVMRYEHDAIKSILESGMDLGFDAAAAGAFNALDKPDQDFVNRLAIEAPGRIWVEPRPSIRSRLNMADIGIIETYNFWNRHGHDGSKDGQNYRPIENAREYLLLMDHTIHHPGKGTPLGEVLSTTQSVLDRGYTVGIYWTQAERLVRANRWPSKWRVRRTL